MAGHVNWNGDQFAAQVKAEMGRRLNASAIVVESHAKTLINTAGTSGGAQYDADGKRIKGAYKKLKYNTNPSKPGDPPHKQTGNLQRSVTHEVSVWWSRARIGTNVKYGRWLELGTKWMAARPWLRRSLTEVRAAVVAILTRPM